jgi:hypothetical protein
MLHSVIIPHRNRNADLRHCLWALGQSARACELTPHDVEVLVVDTRSDDLPEISGYGCRTRLVFDPSLLASVTITHDHGGGQTSTTSHRVYCKPAALNVGLDAAKGELLTFLDADSIVGPRFFGAWDELAPLEITKLAYRVKRIDDKGVKLLEKKGSLSLVETRERWGHLSLATEIYVTPGNDIAIGNVRGVPEEFKVRDPNRVIGNSQFTIPRENLRGRRWNEDYVGAGYEDLDMLRGIYRDYGGHGGDYRAEIALDPDYAIMQIPTPDNNQPDWRPPGLSAMNVRRYFGECPSKSQKQ